MHVCLCSLTTLSLFFGGEAGPFFGCGIGVWHLACSCALQIGGLESLVVMGMMMKVDGVREMGKI